MNFIKTTTLGVAILAATVTVFTPTNASAATISYSDAFSQSMQNTYMNVADRINDLDSA